MLQKIRGQLYLCGLRHSLNALVEVSPEKAGMLAFELLSIPRRGGAAPERLAILESAEKKDLHLAGHRISSYRWRGRGRRVLLLHGWESDASRWKDLIETLRVHGHDVLAIDAPAHGSSGGRRFTAVLYAYVVGDLLPQFSPHAVVGHSAGGMAAAYQLFREEKHFPEKLALLATPSELTDLLEVYQQHIGFNDRVLQALDRAFERRFDHPSRAFSICRFVEKLQVSGLVIHDRQDPVAHYGGAVAIHRSWAGSRLITTDGLGHSLNAREVVEEVAQFVG